MLRITIMLITLSCSAGCYFLAEGGITPKLAEKTGPPLSGSALLRIGLGESQFGMETFLRGNIGKDYERLGLGAAVRFGMDDSWNELVPFVRLGLAFPQAVWLNGETNGSISFHVDVGALKFRKRTGGFTFGVRLEQDIRMGSLGQATLLTFYVGAGSSPAFSMSGYR